MTLSCKFLQSTHCFFVLFLLITPFIAHTHVRLVHGSGHLTADEEYDHVLLSFPKSGRTWLRLMLGYVFTHHFELQRTKKGKKLSEDEIGAKAMKLRPLAEFHCKVPLIEVDHVYSEMEFKTPEQWQFPEVLNDRSVLLLIRDPRDACVSNFFQKRFRHNLQFDDPKDNKCDDYKDLDSPVFKFKGEQYCDDQGKNCSCFPVTYTVRDFVHEPHGGFVSTCHYSAFFYKYRFRLRQMLVVRYEDLKMDTVAELQRIMLFFGITNVSNKTLQIAADEASFSAMRQKELDGQLGNRLSVDDTSNPLAFKTRSGTIGGFREFFEHDMATQAWMAQTMLHILPPAFGYNREFVLGNATLSSLGIEADLRTAQDLSHLKLGTDATKMEQQLQSARNWRTTGVILIVAVIVVVLLKHQRSVTPKRRLDVPV